MKKVEHFRTAALGGFQKEDVLEFIENLVSDHERKCEALYETISEMRQEKELVQAHCEKLQSKFKQALVQLQSAKKELATLKEKQEKELQEKAAALQQLELQNKKLLNKNAALDERINQLHNLHEKQQGNLQWKEQSAREKTKNMIRQAKTMVETEYHQRMQEAEQESMEMVTHAKHKAEDILTTSSKHAQDILQKTQREVSEMIENAQRDSSQIIERANLTARRILSDITEKATNYLGEKEQPGFGKTQERTRLEFNQMKQFINKEIGDALRYLDNASSSVQTARNKVANIHSVQKDEKGKTRRTLRDFFD